MTKRGKVLIGFAVAAGIAAVLLAALRLGIDPAWSLVVAVLLPIAVVLIRRYPALLIAGMLFVGNYKTHAAVGISLTDPTLIIVGLLAATTAWELLLIVGGVGEKTLGELFRGQKWGVLAFLLLQLTLAISFLYTSSPQAATEKLEHIIVFNTLAFLPPFFLFKRERDFQMLLWAVVALAIPIAIRLILGISHPNDKQVFGEADVTYIGDAELLGITILILLYHRFPGRFGRFMTFVALPILSVGMVASIARGPSLVLSAGCGRDHPGSTAWRTTGRVTTSSCSWSSPISCGHGCSFVVGTTTSGRGSEVAPEGNGVDCTYAWNDRRGRHNQQAVGFLQIVCLRIFPKSLCWTRPGRMGELLLR